MFAVVFGARQVGNRTRSSNTLIATRDWAERDAVSGIMRMIHRPPGPTPNAVMVAPAWPIRSEDTALTWVGAVRWSPMPRLC